jgi:hypothetical protein
VRKHNTRGQIMDWGIQPRVWNDRRGAYPFFPLRWMSDQSLPAASD